MTPPRENYIRSVIYKNFSEDQLISVLLNIMRDPRLGPINKITSFAHTPDTFIKMNLIFKKYSSNIPVILMGETGCGKSYLIENLVGNIIGDLLVKIDLHAGVTERELISKIEEIVENNEFLLKKKPSPKKIWLFLDEINTCDSLGLITEMIVKHSYIGKPLPGNIYVICACNPFK